MTLDASDQLADLEIGTATAPRTPVKRSPAPAPPAGQKTKAAKPTVTAAKVVVPASSDDREGFYKSIAQADAAKLRASADRINKKMAGAILEVGQELLEIKDSIPGHFSKWVKFEFGMSRSTAYNYINAVERFGGSPKVIEALPPATVYKLAAKATPDTLRDAVVGEINAGVAVSADDVERRIAEAKNPGAKKNKEDAAHNLRQVTEKSKVSARKLVELLRDNLPDDIFEEFSDGAKGLYFCSDLIEVLREDDVLF